MAKSRATLNGCQILRNLDCGIELNSGGTAEIARSTLSENRVGISLTGAGTSAQLLSSKILQSSTNGAEVQEGALLKLSASEVSNSRERSGVYLKGNLTKLVATSNTSISGNQTHGIFIEDLAAVEIERCRLENNRETAMRIDQAAESRIGNCIFKGSPIGISIDRSAKLELRGSTMEDHADVGLLATNTPLEIDGNRFLNNGDAIIAEEGASGSISNNRTSPKAPADAIVVSPSAGKITQQNNVPGQ
jgi:hypothetical protein